MRQAQNSYYRPEIDGLRAIAVMAVIVHHLHPDLLPSGFLGVDVFFVISGYLIAGIVCDALQTGRLSLVDFWGRRAKRLLPALLLMLGCSSIVASHYLPAYELRQFWASSATATLSVSNIYFWRNTDYFAPEAATQPLLHTWSLGVEEQFYLLFPLLALTLSRWHKLRSVSLWSWLLAGTFCLAMAMWLWRPIAAFYLLPARAFELLAGVCLALFSGGRPSGSKAGWRGELLDALVLLLLLAQLLLPSNLGLESPLSVRICMTTACAAWLIGRTHQPSMIGALLSCKPFTWIGRASYSLYVWHLPVFVLGAYFLPASPALILLVVFALGMLCHVLVETPLRYAKWLSTKAALSLGLALMLASSAYAALRYAWHGLPERPTQDQLTLLNHSYDFAADYELGRCFLAPAMGVERMQECSLPGRRQEYGRVLLWGDSHAAHLLPGLRQGTSDWQSLIHWAVAGCAPQLGEQSRHRPDCATTNERLLERIAELKPELVVLAADWLMSGRQPLAATVDRLRVIGVKHIVVVGPVPRWRNPLPYLVASSSPVLGRMPTRLHTGLDSRIWEIEEQLRGEASALGVDYLSALDVFCNKAGCQTRLTLEESELTSWDHAHLQPQASRKLADALNLKISALFDGG